MMRDQNSSQTFVLLAMGLVTAALAMGLYQHAGLPGPVAATAGLAGYVLLLTLHSFVWKGMVATAAADDAQPKSRLDEELRRMQETSQAELGEPQALRLQDALQKSMRTVASDSAETPPRANFGLAAPRQSADGTATGALPGRAQKLPPPMPTEPNNAEAIAAILAKEGFSFDEPASPPPLPVAKAEQSAAQRAPRAPQASAPQAPAPQAEPRSELPPFVTGRVPSQAGAPQVPPAPPAAAQQPPPLPASAPRAQSPREADVEVLQDAIKRMLEEVNAAEAKPRAAEGGAKRKPFSPEDAIEQSVDALNLASQAMRSGLGDAAYGGPAMPPPLPSAGVQPPPLPQAAPSAPRAWVPPKQAVTPSELRARLLSDAISNGRIDVTLEPILGLEDQATRHFEVAVRLRDVDGQPLDVFGEGPDLRGTGLLPLFDSVSIQRVAAVSRRLDERGKRGSVFSSFNGESVADERFVGELAETLHQRASLATQLVLSFSQADVRDFSTPEWDSIADMRALGFRFAISSITDLDMDFEALADQGFAFVKLDAAVFLRGLPAPGGNIPAADICRHLAKLGLTLVVENIESDDQLARIFGFGVLLGKGQHFGGPRPVRADAVAVGTAAA